MRKSSKMLSLVIALIFLFSAVTPALALSADAPDAGARLKALGVIAGYPDGSLGLDRNITRAEMTVVLSEMYGMGQASEILKNVPSKFSDVATGAWYTGYINLAQQQGWVSGYPDGSFKPNANVSYAEAITMIVNLLGYGKGELPGTWPLNYVVQATDLGITSGVTYSANSPAPRGDVFVMASKALDKEMVSWSKDESEFVKGDLLITRLSLTELKDVVVRDAYMLLGNSENDREDRIVSIDSAVAAEDGDYEVAAGFDIRPYVGLKSTFYVNDDDEIVAVKKTTAVSSEKLEAITVGSGVYELELDNSSSTTYDIDPNGVFIVNEEVVDVTDLDGITDGTVNYVVSSRQVVFLEVVDYNAMASNIALVEEVDIDDELIDISAKAGNDLGFDLDDDYVVVKGAASSLDEIEENDVVYWNNPTSTNDFALFVVRDSVEGYADRFTTTSIRIAGKSYDVATGWYESTNNGKDFTNAGVATSKFSEEDVVAYLNGYGKIFALAAQTSATADNVAYAMGNIRVNTVFGEDQYRVKLFLADGTIGNYYFDADFVDDNSAIFDGSDNISDFADMLVEYGLSDDGEIDAFSVYSKNQSNVTALDEDDTKVDRVVTSAGRYFVTNSTVVINLNTSDSDKDPELLKWADVKALGDVASAPGKAYGESVTTGVYDLTFLVFNNPLSTSDNDYAVYYEAWQVGSTNYFSYVVKSGIVEAKAGTITGTVSKGTIVELTSVASDGKASISVVNSIYEEIGTIPSGAYDSTRNTLKVSTTGGTIVYDVDSDTIVVDVTGTGAPSVKTLSQLTRDDEVKVFSANGLYADVIVITD